jgi:hypothetical protein
MSLSNEILLSGGGLSARIIRHGPELAMACGSRFDQSGIVRQVDFGGHTFFSVDLLNGLLGTAEEFSTTDPPGFADAPFGGEFYKIGAGLFRKNRPDYTFHQPWECIRLSEWSMSHGPDWAEFKTSENQWLYTKLLKVAENTMTVSRTLENRGSEPLCTDHYAHPFLRIDGAPAGPDIQVDFDAPLILNEPRSRALGLAEFDGRTFSLSSALSEEQSVMLYFQPLEKMPQRVEVKNRQTGAAVSIETSLPVSEWRLFATRFCICPEPFVQLNIPPGESTAWQTCYRFSTRSITSI